MHSLGFRFRLHRRDLPGTPDIVLPKYKTVILVHGCFWHRHPGCPKAYLVKGPSRKKWAAKFKDNVERDARVCRQLLEAGWEPVVVWECETVDVRNLGKRLMNAIARCETAVTGDGKVSL